jgi:hypothetical protein
LIILYTVGSCLCRNLHLWNTTEFSVLHDMLMPSDFIWLTILFDDRYGMSFFDVGHFISPFDTGTRSR